MNDTTRPLWQWTATEIARATRAGEITAHEVTEAALARMDAGKSTDLNAVVESLAE
jgi:amidase